MAVIKAALCFILIFPHFSYWFAISASRYSLSYKDFRIIDLPLGTSVCKEKDNLIF